MKVRSSQRLHVTLDQRVAEELCALLGGIEGTGPLRDLFVALDAELPARTFSFSDIFVGSIAYAEEE